MYSLYEQEGWDAVSQSIGITPDTTILEFFQKQPDICTFSIRWVYTDDCGFKSSLPDPSKAVGIVFCIKFYEVGFVLVMPLGGELYWAECASKEIHAWHKITSTQV